MKEIARKKKFIIFCIKNIERKWFIVYSNYHQKVQELILTDYI